MAKPHLISVVTTAFAIAATSVLLAQGTTTKPPTTKPAAPQAATTTKPAPKPPAGAKAFPTAQAAATALIEAAAAFNESELLAIFGPDGTDLVKTDDPVRDKSYALAFAELAKQKQTVVVSPSNAARATIEVGPDRWPLPVPLVRVAGKWYFDANAGREEVLFRRVGANELDAIEVCRGFVEAQKEYAFSLHDGSKLYQYAQRLISTPGKQDGLYWKNPDGSDGGPISETVAKAIEEGYSLEKSGPYHGYIFQVLKGQGPAARLGELDYMINGAMIGGFALIATPAEYGVTGVHTFIVNHDGIVYQKDLGPDSLAIAKKIDRYNPDKTWTRTNDAWVK